MLWMLLAFVLQSKENFRNSFEEKGNERRVWGHLSHSETLLKIEIGLN